MLHVLDGLPRRKLGHRPQGFDLKEIIIRKGLERTTEVRIGLSPIRGRPLHEYFIAQDIRSPSIRIEHSQLLSIGVVGILTKYQVLPCEFPSGVCKVGVCPHYEWVGGLQISGMFAARRESGHCYAALRHHGERPWGKVRSEERTVRDAMVHNNARPGRCHADLDFFLKISQRFNWLCGNEAACR